MQYTFGLYTVYVINSRVMKQSMRSAIAAGIFQPQQVVYIAVPLQGLTEAEAKRWQQHEIQYGGKLYDVIKTYHEAEKLVVQCLCDEDENNLVGSFLKTMQKAHRPAGKSTSPLRSLFSPFTVDDGWYIANRLIYISITYIQKPAARISKGFQHVPAPPPWQV